jgi:periplasmic protein TonB
MRTRTFVLSFLVHAVMIGAAMVVRIVATTELPEPPSSTAFMMATPQVPEVQPPPVRSTRAATAPAVNPDAAPIEEPDSLAPEPTDLPDTVAVGSDVILGFPGSDVGDPVGPAPPPTPPRPSTPPPPIRVGTGIRAPQKVHHVAPRYPDIAVKARISGVVILEATLAEDGSVRDARVLRSVPLLDDAAMEAVRQWRFTPTLLNGTPVPVIMTVTVTFSLN